MVVQENDNAKEKKMNDEKMIDENGAEWIVGYGDDCDYIPGLDDGEWESDEDCCGEEDFA
jgi:hypothetical protein